jgi:hypothetical protein
MSTKVNKAQAIALDYSGLEIVRVESWDRSNPTFFVVGPRFDIDIVLNEEMKDESLPVYLPAILRSVEKIDALLAKTNIDGVWVKPKEQSAMNN